MLHHTSDAECPLCVSKLQQCHPDMVSIFIDLIKPVFVDCHISWTYRDEANQRQAFAEGKSKLSWPMSAHNKSDDQGNPQSLAFDLFQLCSNGMAAWPWAYFRDINTRLYKANKPVFWGGNYKHLGDADHFELQIKDYPTSVA